MMLNWEFNHLGMMVTDRDEILGYYQSIVIIKLESAIL